MGDQWDNRSQVLEFRASANSLHTKVVPMQWGGTDPAGTPGDCIFESWVSLEGNVVRVDNRLLNARVDRAWYDDHYQEVPAVYTVGELHHVWTYKETNPWSGEPASEMPAGFPWTYWRATESWAALTNDQGWGLGVYHPGVYLFGGGFYPYVDGTTVLGGPTDDPTGYVSPVRSEVVDWNIAYEYTYYLILGTVSQVRSYVYEHRPPRTPQWVFERDRSHWVYVNATDSGWPIEGGLRVDVGRLDRTVIGPECAFQAADVPWLYIKAAHHVANPAPARRPGSSSSSWTTARCHSLKSRASRLRAFATGSSTSTPWECGRSHPTGGWSPSSATTLS